MARRTAALSIRIDPELKKELERLAEADRRSVASLVEKVLADFVESKKQQQ
ncbi:MAG: ribbon-helix-helix protein, CopG family [Alphaproteobacteria bacterium]|jgi:predicted transcriptional regulator|nr:ribbon-helix-helix protein, CopG family [Alphaproteobacteria bacterium]